MNGQPQDTTEVSGFPYGFPVGELKPGMLAAYSRLVVKDVGKTGESFKRGNAGTYYEEWYVDLEDPLGEKKSKRYQKLTEFDTVSMMLDADAEPIMWKEGLSVQQKRSLF